MAERSLEAISDDIRACTRTWREAGDRLAALTREFQDALARAGIGGTAPGESGDSGGRPRRAPPDASERQRVETLSALVELGGPSTAAQVAEQVGRLPNHVGVTLKGLLTRKWVAQDQATKAFVATDLGRAVLREQPLGTTGHPAEAA